MFEYIEKELIENIDKKYLEFNKKLCPDTNKNMLGVRIPILRKIAQKISKEENWKDFLKENETEYIEQVILEGLVIAYVKIDIDEKLKLFESFIPKIDSWSITDVVCPTIKPKKNEIEKVWSFIQRYINSPNEFEIRFGVVMMKNYFLNDKYIDDVIKKLDLITTDKYYARMAIAWTLAEVGIKFNEKIMFYLKNKNNLDDFTYNKTLQKMIESYRISDKQKEELRKMKR